MISVEGGDGAAASLKQRFISTCFCCMNFNLVIMKTG